MTDQPPSPGFSALNPGSGLNPGTTVFMNVLRVKTFDK